MSSKKKKNILFAVLVFFLIVIIAGLAYIFFVLFNDYKGRSDYEAIRESAVSVETKAATEGEALASNPVDFDSLTERNDEIYAWINVPGTNVDYPVLQSKTSDFFYLEHDLDKNYLFAGSIYTEAANLRDFSDRNTVLYGHNMLDGSMFATLHRFEDKEFFDENRYIYIYQKNRKLTYEIVSAYNYDERHLLNSFNFSDDEVFEQYLEYVKNPRSTVANVRDDVELTLDSKLITLSTCLDGYEEGRYLVQGVLIKDEATS